MSNFQKKSVSLHFKFNGPLNLHTWMKHRKGHQASFVTTNPLTRLSLCSFSFYVQDSDSVYCSLCLLVDSRDLLNNSLIIGQDKIELFWS